MRPLRNNRSVVSVKYANKCLLVREGGGNLSEENYGVVLGVFVQLGRLNKKLLLPLSGNKTVSVHIGDALPPGFTRSHAKKDCSHKELIVNLTADFETCFLISSRRFLMLFCFPFQQRMSQSTAWLFIWQLYGGLLLNATLNT